MNLKNTRFSASWNVKNVKRDSEKKSKNEMI